MKLFYTLMFSLLIFMSLMQPVAGIFHKLSLVISLFIIIVSVVLHKKIIVQNVQASVFFSMYTFFCVIAAGVNQDMVLLKNSLQLMCLFFAVSIFFNDLVKEHVLEIILNSVQIAYIPFLVLCFQQANYMYEAFAGVFENPNTMGFSMIGLMIVVLMRLYDVAIKMLHGQQQIKNILSFLLYTIIYLVGMYVILLSNARTSLLTVAFATVVVIVCIVKSMNKTFLPFIKFVALFTAVGVGLVMVMLKMDRMQVAVQSILLKMERKSTNITDGRLEIWQYVFEHFNFWGHGVESLWSIGVSHAHNTFINILQEAGLLALISYGLFLLTIAKGYRQMNEQLIVFTGLIIVAVLGISTFEILYFNMLHILVFAVSGSIRDKGKIATLSE
ncbi:O-antigen ligase family protein [Lysinibacillus sp. FSL K6-0075]|uniref:O-antigen ligase family protein n=1 Tax=Lysinibacillus TaxID=400634 RepID=UPI0019671518|nr:O-antigen ligase family protein [Lysinibacillus fusiformis]QSB08311.1 O-antigen ligase family protein [Lysinibacillus fusiformis]